MKQLFGALLIVGMLSGCLVRTRPGTSARRGGGCGPAYHWDGYACVHNGNGNGNGKGKGRR